MKFIKKCFLLMLLAISALWLICILKSEYYTLRHGSKFQNEWQQAENTPRPEEFKVLKYTGEYAEVYYFGENRSEVMAFRNRDGCWEINRRIVVRYAEDKHPNRIVFPYLWHFIM